MALVWHGFGSTATIIPDHVLISEGLLFYVKVWIDLYIDVLCVFVFLYLLNRCAIVDTSNIPDRRDIPMTEEAKQIRREYQKQWRQQNRDKIRKAEERHWEKKAAQAKKDVGQRDS